MLTILLVCIADAIHRLYMYGTSSVGGSKSVAGGCRGLHHAKLHADVAAAQLDGNHYWKIIGIYKGMRSERSAIASVCAIINESCLSLYLSVSFLSFSEDKRMKVSMPHTG